MRQYTETRSNDCTQDRVRELLSIKEDKIMEKKIILAKSDECGIPFKEGEEKIPCIGICTYGDRGNGRRVFCFHRGQ